MQGAQDDLTPPAALASLGGLATPLSPSSSVLPNMPGKFSRVDSPVRSSPRKLSTGQQSSRANIITPLSISPTLPSHPSFPGAHRLPPAFEAAGHSRYAASRTPFSPYRPGEYGRSERGTASERTKLTKVERRLFPEDKSRSVGERDLTIPKYASKDIPPQGSSPLGSAFEAKMVLRNGASIDLMSWLRTNFHHIPEQQHNSMTPSMPLIGIRALLLERFPRVPDLSELSKAVLVAFPHSRWEVSKGAFGDAESPMLRGLVWHGKDVADEEDDSEEEHDEREREREQQRIRESRRQIVTRAQASKPPAFGSRSPSQSTLVSPISSSKRAVPNTPARSVLDEFAEIATLADKTPASKAQSLPAECIAPAPAYALANICNSFDARGSAGLENYRKRRASESPEPVRRRSSTPDKLQGLLAAAEAVEGNPISSVLSHKRRRTIGGSSVMRDVLQPGSRKRLYSRGTVSPRLGERMILPELNEAMEIEGEMTTDLMVPLNDTASAISLTDLETVSHVASGRPHARGHTASTASQVSVGSNISNIAQPQGPESTSHKTAGSSRRANELPTQGDHPGVDCKPPFPYHEMIRHAIEEAPDRRLQLSQIYSSIADRFPFFKTLDEKKTSGWQNSIRHNLSLKKMFVRVNKVDGIPDDNGGKGGWWTVNVGVHDEGRPGRKSKGKKRNSGEAIEDIVDGDGQVEQSSHSASMDPAWRIDSSTAFAASLPPPMPTAMDEKTGLAGFANASLGLSVEMAPPQYAP